VAIIQLRWCAVGGVLIVDGANVVGSVPNGWWRDRAGAARRLRDSLVSVAADGVPGVPGPVEVLLVVEGAARDIESIDGVRVIPARSDGDDRIVELVGERVPVSDGETPARDAADGAPSTGPVVVVTADRALRDRVTTLGATVVGPRSLPYCLQ
jgi:hypothetical protein